MYLHEVSEGVARVEASMDDPEAAHGWEDALMEEILRAIATGQCKGAPPEDFATEVLKVKDLKFSRWYA